MRALILCLIILVAVACVPTEPVIITVTPVPPTSTPIPAEGEPVNRNSTLDGHYTVISVGNLMLNHFRDLAIPPEYTYMGEVANEIPPFFFQAECQTENDSACLKLQVDNIAGTFGLYQENINLNADTTYVVKVRLSEVNLTPSPDQTWADGNIGITGRVKVTDGTATTLLEQMVPQQSGTREVFWVIRTSKRNPTITLEIWFNIRWASILGTILVDDIEIFPVADDFGEDVLVPFSVG